MKATVVTRRIRIAAAAVFVAAGTLVAQADTRPTIAVVAFTNGALGAAHAELDPLSAGMQDLLIFSLSANPKIRVVERANLQALINEQNLGASGRVDAATAAHLGKILGAGHMIMGGFVTDTQGAMRLVARSVNVETSLVEYSSSVDGKQADVMLLITRLADQINAGLKLPPLATGTKEAALDQAKKVPFQATMLYSRALAAKDAGNKDEAVQLLQKSLAAFPEFGPAQQELKKLQPPPSGTE
jgi:curli biogenesis system outer membrane secretion channel CsgG